MRKKIFSIFLTIVLFSCLLIGCTQPADKGNKPGTASSSTPSSAAISHNQIVPEPLNQTSDTAAAQDQPSTPTSTVNKTPAKILANDNKPMVMDHSMTKTSLTTSSKVTSRTSLSWYYFKQGKGKVPIFPKITKTFSSKQNVVWVGTGKKVYLTFDNGGPMGDTSKLLQTLKDNNVKATFFIAGYNLRAHPDFFKQLIADGHQVANHTMSHKDMTTLSDDQVKKEIINFQELYKKITGEELQKYFRFPYGTYNDHLLSLVSEMGYTSVFWSTAMKDWVPRTNGASDAYHDIMNNLHDGNVILMHQGSGDDIEALDRIIKGIKQAGYEFALVNDLQPPTKS